MDFFSIESDIQSFNYTACHRNIFYFNMTQEEVIYIQHFYTKNHEEEIFLLIFGLIKKTLSIQGVMAPKIGWQ